MRNLFKDPEAQADSLILTEKEFIAKYKTTTTKENTIRSIYVSLCNSNRAAGKITENSSEAVDFPTKEVEDEEVLESEHEVKKQPKADKETTNANKTSRASAIRELVKVHGKDKQKIKRLLSEEGFSCDGASFHSEWSRITKKL